MTDTTTQAATPEVLWAIVELFGHQRLAGRVSEQAFGGASFVRIDVPEIKVTESRYSNGAQVQIEKTIPAHTRSFGAKAIYSINWVDEPAARIAAHGIKHEPLSVYSVRQALDGMEHGDRMALLGHHDADD